MPSVHVILRNLLATRGADATAATSRKLAVDDRALAKSLPWDDLAEACEYHGVTLLVEPAIRWLIEAAPEAVPTKVRRAFGAQCAYHRQATAVRERCIDELLSAFSQAGLPMVLLKGAALAHIIYQTAALRAMNDIDILIVPADVKAATAIAQRLGYVFAPHYQSPFAYEMHHLPPAFLVREGFRITLEIHTETMAPDQSESLDLSKLSEPPRSFQRGNGPAGFALGHEDMLRHLARHAFEPVRRIRLIHLFDLWRYGAVFKDEIGWARLHEQSPYVGVVLSLVAQAFETSDLSHDTPAAKASFHPEEVGRGMIPLAEIAGASLGPAAKLSALLRPPAWWLHGYYGVPVGVSLASHRLMYHPLTVGRWLARRLQGIVASRPGALRG